MIESTAQRYGPVETAVLLLLSLSWGLSFLFIEVALRGLSPLWIVAARTFVGGGVLLVVLTARGRRLPSTWRFWRQVLIIGAVNNALPWTAVAWAQQSLPSGLTALLMALVPMSTLLVSAAIGSERLTGPRVAGLLLAMVGVGLIVGGDVDEPGRLLAVGAVVSATLLYALGAVYAKRQLSGVWPPLVIATGQVLAASAVSLPLAMVFGGRVALAGLELPVIGAVAALGAFGTGFAFVLFYTLIERVGATNATLTTYLIPVVAVIAGVLVLGESIGLAALAGGATIVIGILLTQRATYPPLTPP